MMSRPNGTRCGRPTGDWLYFLSNRSGSMNLWRIGIDEASGVAHGGAQPMSAPAPYIRNFTLSADGRAAAYATWTISNNLSRVRFNPQTATTQGDVQRITTGPRDFCQTRGEPERTAGGRRVVPVFSRRTCTCWRQTAVE